MDTDITKVVDAVAYVHKAAAHLRHRAQGLNAGKNLDGTIDFWADYRQLNDQLAVVKALLNAIADTLTDEIVPNQLDLYGLSGAPHKRGLVKLNHHTKASIRDGQKADAYDWLRENDLGDLIIQTVNSRTLGATAKELIAKGKDLPSEIFDVTTRRYASLTKGDK